jgi:tRNA threonylcarbamoyladenosine biosynthesis protein TsaB
MKLLAIDTSTEVASVALMVGNEISCQEQPSQRMHAQLLLPMIDKLMIEADLKMNHLDGVIFGCGPGSFTGLRIACSIAKGLAYAHDLGVIPVGSLAAIAHAVRAQKPHSAVLAVLDARMNELYWGYFLKDTFIAVDNVTKAQDIQLPNEESIVLAGIGIDVYWDCFPDSLKSQVSSRLPLYPNAAAMIRLALDAAIEPISAAAAAPVYVRNKVTQGEARG